MRNSITLMLLAMLGSSLRAQQQLENPSFESWTSVGQATQEPTEWSSLKTSDGGAFINGLVPQLCWRSNDAHTGTYSVNLRTEGSIIGPANGLLTNGRVHAELDVANSYMYTVLGETQWSTPLSSRPDSLVGWFKASPEPGDRPNVGVLLHIDEGRLPAFGTENNYVAGASWKGPYATVGEWTRFSTPFQYLNDWEPEWILFILTAGDSAGSVEGTQAWYDDLALIYNVSCAPSTEVVTANGALDVDYSTGGIPAVPTDFTVELSNASGDFTSPVVIGSAVSSSATGSIPCVIPEGTVAGTGYRIRIVTDSPFYAPVGCSVQVELGTGLSTAMPQASLTRWTEDGLVINANGASSYACYNGQGSVIATGFLAHGANTISLDAHGMLLVRVTNVQGSLVERLVMP